MKKILLLLTFLYSLEVKAQYFEPIGNGIGIDSVTNPNDGVLSLCADSAHHFLAISGRFQSADGAYYNGSCNWNGTDYNPLGPIGSNGVKYNSVMWNGYLVMSNNNNLYLFDSTQLVPSYFPPLFNGAAYIEDMITLNGDLYIAGGFYLSDGTFGIARWNDTTGAWVTVGGGLTGFNSFFIQALGTYNGDLIAAGDFDNIGNHPANHIARWDGTQWN